MTPYDTSEARLLEPLRLPRTHVGSRAVLVPGRTLGLALALLAVVATSGCGGNSQPARLPDVILISIDTLRADHLGCYGYPVDTSPHLDALAAGAVRWEVARSTAPWTLPAHASMFTGLAPYEHGAHTVRVDGPGNNVLPLAASHTTLAELLSRVGYSTHAFVANDTYLRKRWGLDQGFDSWTVKRARAYKLNETLLPWLGEQDERPLFLFLNTMDTHRPYFSTERPGLLPRPVGTDSPALIEAVTPALAAGELAAEDEARLIALRDQYDTSIAHVDEALGALFDRLVTLGRWDDALVIVTSDHGEYFGEHDLIEHSKDVYEPALRVPLLVKFPGQTRGEVRPGPVSVAEIPRIVLSALPEAARELLLPRLPLRDPERAATAENSYSRTKDLRGGPWGDRFQRTRHALYAGPWKFVLSSDGADELYHLERDPDEQVNLIDSEPERATELRVQLEGLLARPRAEAGGGEAAGVG